MNTFTLFFIFEEYDEEHSFNADVEVEEHAGTEEATYYITPLDENIIERFGIGPHKVRWFGTEKGMTCDLAGGGDSYFFMEALMKGVEGYLFPDSIPSKKSH